MAVPYNRHPTHCTWEFTIRDNDYSGRNRIGRRILQSYRSSSIRRCRVATCRDASISNVKDPNHSGGMEQPNRSGPRVPSVLRSALHPITSREWKTEIMTSAGPSSHCDILRVSAVSSFSPPRLRVADFSGVGEVI